MLPACSRLGTESPSLPLIVRQQGPTASIFLLVRVRLRPYFVPRQENPSRKWWLEIMQPPGNSDVVAGVKGLYAGLLEKVEFIVLQLSNWNLLHPELIRNEN